MARSWRQKKMGWGVGGIKKKSLVDEGNWRTTENEQLKTLQFSPNGPRLFWAKTSHSSRSLEGHSGASDGGSWENMDQKTEYFPFLTLLASPTPSPFGIVLTSLVLWPSLLLTDLLNLWSYLTGSSSMSIFLGEEVPEAFYSFYMLSMVSSDPMDSMIPLIQMTSKLNV